MAPPIKRKRGDRNYSSESVDRGRPSPHRPENLTLANGGTGGRGGGARRASRGGRGGGSQQGSSQPPTPTGARKMLPPQNVPAPSPASASATTSTPANTVSAPQRAAPAASATQQMSVPLQGAPPKPDPSGYAYEYFTAERIGAWEENGRQSVINDMLSREDVEEIATCFQEALRFAYEGLLNPQDAGELLKEAMEARSDSEELDLPSLLLDIVAVELTPDNVKGKEVALQQFLRSTGITPTMVGTVLEDALLMALGITRTTFGRMGTRHGTNVLYRQSGYNLLREESEGYAKLLTEYFTVTQNFKPDKETVEKTWEKVKALIGAFDLDVGRVLDITLDAFANHLIKYNKFFVRLLRYSDWWPQAKTLQAFAAGDHGLQMLPPWSDTNYPALETLPEDVERIEALRHGRDLYFWDRVREVGIQAFFELGGRRAIPKDGMSEYVEELANGEAKVDQKGQELLDQWAAKTKTYPPQGNAIAAQILGFKLRFYASDARDASDKMGNNLIWLAALLIKTGFLSLNDLYPHIYPTDDMMDDVRKKLEKKRDDKQRASRPGGGTNALTMAGALADGGDGPLLASSRVLADAKTRSATPSKTDTTTTASESKPELPEPEDQKIQLLKALLMIGAIPDALFILGKYPWLLDLHEDLPHYVFRLLHQMLKKVYAEAQPLQHDQSGQAPGKCRVEVNNAPMLEERQSPKTISWGQLEKTEWSEGDDGTRYRFYWEDWNDLVPICQTVDDVFTLCDSFVNILGHKIGRDAELLSKLIRIGVSSLKQDGSPENFARWQKLAKRLLIPALSLTKEDPGTVNEAWELLRMFPIAVRYNIYAEWNSGQTSRLPDISAAFALHKSQTKDVLKRISKTNIKAMARALAKVAYSSPGVALSTALNQIEAYNNLIEVVIECVRYFTYIGFDVLIWSLLNALGSGSRNRMQADGMLMSKWLQRLSEFTGKISKRYYKDLDLKPILKYVTSQLEKGSSTDLGVLGQMVLSMGGIRADQNWSEAQVMALSGGKTLRSEILKRVADKRHESKSTSTRLIDALTSTNLTGKLLILIALERQRYLERESASGAPIKVLSANLTGLQEACVQYLEFLRSNLSIAEFDAVIPPLEKLVGQYGIDQAIAFAIVRPSIQARILEANLAMEAARKEEKPVTNGDVDMKDAGEIQQSVETAGNGEGDSQPATPGGAGSSAAEVKVHPVLRDVLERLRPVLPDGFEQNMSLSFYVRFWQSSVADIVVPRYDDEIQNTRLTLQQVTNDRSDMSVSGAKKKESRKKELQEMDKTLQNEWKEAIAHKHAMLKTLKEERVLWFTDFPPSKHTELTSAIVQDCLLPRIALSETDALFTAKFIFTIHKLSTPGFRLAKVLARIFNEQQFVATLFMLTEREAKNLGIFLKEVLNQLRIWRENKHLYEKEGAGPNNENPGFAKKVNDDNTVDSKDPEAVLNHIDYQRLLFKWNTQLSKAVIYCLSSAEYMHVRNAILLLKQIHEVFPVLTFHGKSIEERVTALSNDDPRDDIKLSASSLRGDLRKMSKKWLLPAQFRPGDTTAVKAASESRSGSARPGTPQSGNAAPARLNASATEFRPRLPSSGGLGKEEEDGEIKDAEKKAEAVEAVTRTPSSASHSIIAPVGARSEKKEEAMPEGPAADSKEAETKIAPKIPAHGPAALPARPAGPTAPARDPHPDLPRRPEPAEHRDPPRRPEPERTSSRRERLDEGHGRLERSIENARDSLRRGDRSPGHGQRSRNMTPDGRLARPDFDRREPGYGHSHSHGHGQGYGPPYPPSAADYPDPRDPRAMHDWGRGERDIRRSGPEPHRSVEQDRGPRPTEPSARDTAPQQPGSSSVPINPERAALLGLNPDRAALFDQNGPSPRDARDSRDQRHDDERGRRGRRYGGLSPPPQPQRDERPPPVSSRGVSPRRDVGPERPPPRPEHPRSDPREFRDRRDGPAPTPSGPAADVPRGRAELFPGSGRAPLESSHGRLSSRESYAQDPNYGRLAPPSAPDAAPAGPRGRGSRAVTNPTPSGPRNPPASSPALAQPSSPVTDRGQPPAGPARRSSGQTVNTSAPSASSLPSPAETAVHPSRMPQLGISAVQTPATQTSATGPSGPAQAASNSVSGAGSSVPSGPRGSGHRQQLSQGSMPAPSPTGPNGRFPPTGPSSSMPGGRVRGTIGIINNLLGEQRSASTGTNIRGRASLGGQGSAPQSPVGPGPPQQFSSQVQPRSDGQPGPSSAERMESGEGEHRSSRRRDEDQGSSGGRSTRRQRSRSRGPRRDAADNAMRHSGDLPPPSRNGAPIPEPGRDDGGRRRDSRDSSDRERDRERRARGEGHREREREPSNRDRDDGRSDSRRGSERDPGVNLRNPSRNEERGMPTAPQSHPHAQYPHQHPHPHQQNSYNGPPYQSQMGSQMGMQMHGSGMHPSNMNGPNGNGVGDMRGPRRGDERDRDRRDAGGSMRDKRRHEGAPPFGDMKRTRRGG